MDCRVKRGNDGNSALIGNIGCLNMAFWLAGLDGCDGYTLYRDSRHLGPAR